MPRPIILHTISFIVFLSSLWLATCCLAVEHSPSLQSPLCLIVTPANEFEWGTSDSGVCTGFSHFFQSKRFLRQTTAFNIVWVDQAHSIKSGCIAHHGQTSTTCTKTDCSCLCSVETEDQVLLIGMETINNRGINVCANHQGMFTKYFRGYQSAGKASDFSLVYQEQVKAWYSHFQEIEDYLPYFGYLCFGAAYWATLDTAFETISGRGIISNLIGLTYIIWLWDYKILSLLTYSAEMQERAVETLTVQ